MISCELGVLIVLYNAFAISCFKSLFLFDDLLSKNLDLSKLVLSVMICNVFLGKELFV